MKTMIICLSVHHKNTAKIAQIMAGVLDANLVEPGEFNIDGLAEYDLIGFGSGIYFGKHHRALLDLVDKLPEGNNQKVFIFSTRGIESIRFYHNSLRKKLSGKGFDIVGEFACKGWNTVGPLKLIGGINKGRPNQQDLEKAKIFADELKNTAGIISNESEKTEI